MALKVKAILLFQNYHRKFTTKNLIFRLIPWRFQNLFLSLQRDNLKVKNEYKIAETGALERYFRPEGRYGDGVGVIPIDIGNKVRLYCLRLSDKILVFGNGGVKDAITWQESESLAPYVKLLIDTSRFISSRIKDGSLVLVDKEIIGNLNFSRDEEK